MDEAFPDRLSISGSVPLSLGGEQTAQVMLNEIAAITQTKIRRDTIVTLEGDQIMLGEPKVLV